MEARICIECRKPLTIRTQKKFCGTSCAATHNNRGVRRRGNAPTPCDMCGILTNKKFCSLDCFHTHQWIHINRPRVLEGKGGDRTIRRYLIDEYGENCSECNCGSNWNGKALTLQVDHIDGDSDNNQVDNIRLLCPNCHTQTETYGAKGNGSRYRKHTKRNVYLREYKA